MINRNLEEQAKCLFKEMFLSKINDKLPMGWTEKVLSDVSILSAGGDKPKVVSDIKTKDILVPIYSNGITDEGLYGYTDIPKVLSESVTVSARGTIGYVCLRTEPYFPIVRLISLVPKNEIITAKYLYFWLLSLNINGTGTTQQQLTVPNFKNTKIVLPTKEEMISFTKIADSLYATIKNNKIENKELAQLRDTLLPKLMSGELDVSDIDL